MVIKLNGVAAQEEVHKFQRVQLEEKVHKSKLKRERGNFNAARISKKLHTQNFAGYEKLIEKNYSKHPKAKLVIYISDHTDGFLYKQLNLNIKFSSCGIHRTLFISQRVAFQECDLKWKKVRNFLIFTMRLHVCMLFTFLRLPDFS